MITSRTFDTSHSRSYATAANRDKAVAKMLDGMKKTEHITGHVTVFPFELNGRFTCLVKLERDASCLLHNVIDAGFIVTC